MRSIAIALCLATLAYANGPNITPTVGEGEISGEKEPTVPRAEVVKPGEDHDNGDVQVENAANPQSKGNIIVDPSSGADDDTNTTVTFDNRSSGSVSGIEGGDRVIMKGNSSAGITGAGGLVNVVGPKAGGTVTNNGPANGPPIEVRYRNTFSFFVSPGQKVSFGSN